MKKVITNKKKLRKEEQRKHREEVNIIFEEVLDTMFNEKPKKNKCCNKRCENCVNFTPIGEGDHLCIADDPVLILDDYVPTENYFYCNGASYESWDELD